MGTIGNASARLRAWLRRGRYRNLDRDIADELQSHLDLRSDANQAEGMSPEAARRAATRRLGNDLLLRERTRDAHIPRWLADLFRDLRFALRGLRRTPGFTAVAVLTLALGIGASTAMFSVVNAVLINTSPFPHPDRLMQVLQTGRINGRPVQYDNVPVDALDAIRGSGIFAHVGMAGFDNKTLSVDGIVQSGHILQASQDLFQTLGVTPALGRGLRQSSNEIVLAHSLWTQAFHSDPGALGRTVRLDDQPYMVVGVLPAGNFYPLGAIAWIPGPPAAGDTGYLLARLRPEPISPFALERARAAIAVVGQRLARYDGAGLVVAPLRRQLASAPARLDILVLFAAVGFVFLIACANAASLFLARGLGRQSELAVRRALGASRSRLIRLLLAEAAALSAVGSVLGCLLALGAMRLLRLGPAAIPRLQTAKLDPRALMFAVVAAIVGGLAAGLVPAFWLASRDLTRRFQGGAVTTPKQTGRRLLLGTEIALTMALLIGAFLMLRSFQSLLAVQPGFNSGQVLAFEVAAPRMSLATQQATFQQRSLSDQAALARVRGLPGVTAATYGDDLPIGGGNSVGIHLPQDRPGTMVTVDWLRIGPGYFSTLGIPFLRGRDFSAADLVASSALWTAHPPPPVPVLINQAMASALGGSRNPLGQTLAVSTNPGTAVVIGVVADARDISLAALPRPAIYSPMWGNLAHPTFMVRSALPAATLIPMLRSALATPSPGLTMGEPEWLDQTLSASLAQPRFRTLLLSLFAALALLLALVGLYAALAYQVQQRTREIGVRMVLGAGPMVVARMILGQSLGLLAAGIGLGSLLAWGLARYLSSLLFGITALDAPAWIAAAALLVLAGLAASYLPARRATRVDPITALRCE